MLITENDVGQSVGRSGHSACWAVRSLITKLGVDISEAVLFGIGRTAWYCFRAQDPQPMLLTYHPLRLPRMFMALNVPTETYHCWTDKPLAQDSLCGCDGEKLVLEVDKRIFDADGAAGGDGGDLGLYCVWTSRLLKNAADVGWPLVELQVPHTNDRVMVEGSRLARGWRDPASAMAAYTFYLPYTASILWNREVEIRIAIQQWIHQMRQSRSPYGVGGLAALPAFAHALETQVADIEYTRRYALMDGGAAGHRDLLSDFFAEAAEILGDFSLLETASAYANIASAWRIVLGGTMPGAECASSIRDMHALECEALQRLEKDFAS